MKRLLYWLVAHAIAIAAMVAFAALPGLLFYIYTAVAIVVSILLVLNLPLIGLIEQRFYSRELMVGRIEGLLMNVVWVGLASLLALLIFSAEGKPILFTVVHVLDVAVALTFYDLLPARVGEAIQGLSRR